jgi:hypothetical protein
MNFTEILNYVRNNFIILVVQDELLMLPLNQIRNQKLPTKVVAIMTIVTTAVMTATAMKMLNPAP